MEQSSSYKKTIQHQYDALVKKTLKGEAKNYLIELAKRATREVCFSELCESELNRLYVMDEYESDLIRFQVSCYDVFVRNALLGEALETLSERKRNIVLLSYFLDMSDAEIGQLLNVVRSTVFRHRKEGYIARLCTRTLKDDAGNAYSYVDEEMKNRLQVRLITRTLAFHVG